MTSLCPGPLFQTSGLNQNSTPTPPTATPSEIDRKLIRQPFNGDGDWPRDSPVARVYDVANTSTSLVLLNRRRKKKSQLRGLTVRSGDIAAPEPQRHAIDESTVSEHYHKRCLNSSSEPYRPRIHLDLGWVNNSQRPPVRFDSGSHVNHRRHTSCRVSSENPVGWNGVYHRRPATSTTCGMDSELRSLSPVLNDPDLPAGGRRYLHSIARIYSTGQMKQLKQDQYHQLLFKELNKGYHSPKEYERYLSYLNTPRKTQFGKLDNYVEMRRSKSAPPPADTMSGRGAEKGSAQRRPTYSSRSWAPSMISSSSRPSTRQKGGKKKTTPKRKQSPPPPSPKPVKDTNETKDKRQSPEPSEDMSNHTRKEESEAGDEPLSDIKESEEKSSKSRESSSKSQPPPPPEQKEKESTLTTITTVKDEDGVSPRKEEEGVTPRKDVMSPRKDDEETPRKDDGRANSGRDERSSVGGAPSAIAPSSTNTTSNNFLALIVSDAEKEDDNRTVDDSEEKQSSAEETTTTTQPMARDFSDNNLALGYSPRINQEGRTRPLSRAGRGSVERKDNDKENSDDDYDDTDEETERAGDEKDTSQEKQSSPPPPPPQQQQQQPQQEKTEEQAAGQQSVHEPQPAVLDSSRTDDSKAEERGAMEEEPTPAVESDRRAGSADENRDERAQDSRETDGNRSLIIPVTQSSDTTTPANDNVLDLSAEGRNRDVDKLEY